MGVINIADFTPSFKSGMQKSRSSTSVVQQGSRLVAKKIWKSRSKSQSRATPSATSTWTPQGDCLWSNVTGRSVRLEETQLTQLTDLERRVLQKVALAKLQALNLGVPLKIPPEHAEAVVQKPKRRAYLLKRKAQTTAFDPSRKDPKDKEGGGMVFGVPLSQCVENERGRLDIKSLSRASFSSLITPPQGGSCESLISPTLSMPGLDSLSCGSTQNLGEATGGSGVPNLVTSCLRHLETFGLHTLGIFRVSSSKKRVRQLREDFDCGKHVNLEDEQCPHDVATLLKEYFRDLPDPILCKDLYQAFIHTQRIRNRRLQQEALQHLVQLLPVANRDTLWSLLNLLYMVSINSNDHKNVNGEWVSGNKMDSSNLATMFAPNLLHPCTTRPAKEELSAERTEERADAINVIRTLIDNHKALFQISAELLDEVYVHMMDSHPEALDQLLRQRDTAPNQNEDTSDEAEKKTWVKEDIQERIVSSTVEKSRRERGRERRRRGDLSSDSGQNTPDEGTEGVITASLKIPVPGGAWNLDDIPYIEESGGRSESGVGSMSRGGSSTWESSDSEAHHPLRVTIHHTSLVQQVQPSYSSRTDSNWSRSSRERLTKSASSSAVIAGESTRAAEASRVAETVISRAAEKRSTAITCIGDRVMRSKTADFERMLNRGKASAAWEKEYKRKYAERQEEAPRPTKGLWKRRELISSQPKDKSSYY